MRRIVVGVSGASGMPLAHTLLRHLADLPESEIHLIVSDSAQKVLRAECDGGLDALVRHAHRVHDAEDMAAGPSSGSWRHSGMIICPCSMSSLASIACGAGNNLIHRAADVTLKERRPLILVARETPLSGIHLHNLQIVTEAGATVMPFIPAFYNRAVSLEDMMRHFCGRVLDQLHISHTLCARWRDDA